MVGAVVGEVVNADHGFGYLIITANAVCKVPLAWGALLVLFQRVVIVEQRFFPWAVDTDESTL